MVNLLLLPGVGPPAVGAVAAMHYQCGLAACPLQNMGKLAQIQCHMHILIIGWLPHTPFFSATTVSDVAPTRIVCTWVTPSTWALQLATAEFHKRVHFACELAGCVCIAGAAQWLSRDCARHGRLSQCMLARSHRCASCQAGCKSLLQQPRMLWLQPTYKHGEKPTTNKHARFLLATVDTWVHACSAR